MARAGASGITPTLTTRVSAPNSQSNAFKILQVREFPPENATTPPTALPMIVSDTHFKVHQYCLCPENDETAFTGFFALLLPDSGAAKENQDHAPSIILEGDSLDQVRAFLGTSWILGSARIPDSDLPKLIATAQFTHKYRLESFEHWANETISVVTNGTTLRAGNMVHRPPRFKPFIA
ncbi:hypothetical protein C8J57DRAFT_1509191 [Mycena rebaudengoi]|nr:hypothetical protein C8J57DRAFT_1509191 [Mycena rebaudengoi]